MIILYNQLNEVMKICKYSCKYTICMIFYMEMISYRLSTFLILDITNKSDIIVLK